MIIMGKKLIVLLAVIIAIAACRKRPDPVIVPDGHDPRDTTHTHDTTAKDTTVVNPDTLRSLKINFENEVDGQPLILDSATYVSASGDSYVVKKYRYYISNIKLETADGKIYAEPESYHLIDHKNTASRNLVLKNLPDGTYNKITFLIGVDSLRNVSGAQTGDLDPIKGMFWDWNTGYIMSQIEGKVLDGSRFGIFMALHLGGYGRGSSVLRWVTLTLPQPVVVKGGAKPGIYIKSNVAEWFRTPVVYNLRQNPQIMSLGSKAETIANNYEDMFTVDRTE